MTYDELVADVETYTEKTDLTETDSEGNKRIDRLINQAERRILRDVDLEVFRSTDSLTTSSGTETVTLSNAPIVLRSVTLTTSSGNRVPLRRMDESFLEEFWTDPSSTDTPRYYTLADSDTLKLAPVPDDSYSLDAYIITHPTGLSSSNTTTWLSENAGDVLLSAVLLEAHEYMKSSPEVIKYHKEQYVEAMRRLMRSNMSRNKTTEFVSGEPVNG